MQTHKLLTLLIDWLIDCNFVYRRYPAKLLIPVVDVPTSPERKCNIHVCDTALHPIYPRDIILTSLVLVHAGYLFCNWHPLNTNYYGTTFNGMPESFNTSQINACIVGVGVLGPQLIVSSQGLGLHKMLPQKRFEPSTSRMPGKHCTPRPQLPFMSLILCGNSYVHSQDEFYIHIWQHDFIWELDPVKPNILMAKPMSFQRDIYLGAST